MRIIAGKHKGRRIELGKEAGQIVRPTSDYAREAIFNILCHGKHGLNGHSFSDKRVLDVFCGTGAFGLEALSRGAKHVTFIDNAREALNSARHNIQRIGEEPQVDFMLANATQLGKSRGVYDLVFLDPPYFKGMLVPTLNSLVAGGWVNEASLLVIEHDAKESISIPESFSKIDERKYGRAMVELLKYQPQR